MSQLNMGIVTKKRRSGRMGRRLAGSGQPCGVAGLAGVAWAEVGIAGFLAVLWAWVTAAGVWADGVGEVPFWARAGSAAADSNPAASAIRVTWFMALVPGAGRIAGTPETGQLRWRCRGGIGAAPWRCVTIRLSLERRFP